MPLPTLSMSTRISTYSFFHLTQHPKIQPLNQGIIRSVKRAYRKTIQVQYCSHVGNYEEVKQIMQSFDFVVAVNTLVDAWEGVKPELIQTCFHTAGFMTYVPPPPEPLPEPPRNLWERMQNIFDVNCTFEEYATADDHAVITAYDR